MWFLTDFWLQSDLHYSGRDLNLPSTEKSKDHYFTRRIVIAKLYLGLLVKLWRMIPIDSVQIGVTVETCQSSSDLQAKQAWIEWSKQI